MEPNPQTCIQMAIWVETEEMKALTTLCGHARAAEEHVYHDMSVSRTLKLPGVDQHGHGLKTSHCAMANAKLLEEKLRFRSTHTTTRESVPQALAVFLGQPSRGTHRQMVDMNASHTSPLPSAYDTSPMCNTRSAPCSSTSFSTAAATLPALHAATKSFLVVRRMSAGGMDDHAWRMSVTSGHMA